MRAFLALCLLSVSGLLPAQAWEKRLAPGLTYRMEVDATTPRIVHVLRYAVGSPEVRMQSELASPRIFDESEARGRATVSSMAERLGALAVVNGDFFPFTGDPLGFMMRGGEFLSGPWPGRSVFFWGRQGASLGTVAFTASALPDGGDAIPIQGWNQENALNEVTLNTAVTGFSRAKLPNVHVTLRVPEAKWSRKGEVEGTVEALAADQASVPVADGTVVLVGHGARVAPLAALRPGQKVRVRYETTGVDAKAEEAMGGGPTLVRNGAVAVDWQAQRFQPAFAEQRHPRTALGRTADGDLLMVVVDGRQKMSAGATLEELARILVRLGAADAINLDGGGSSAVNVLGLTLNRPSDGRERPVANGVALFGPMPAPTDQPLVLAAPVRVSPNASITLAVRDGDGKPVPNAEVLWAAQGAAWVDQGGLLRTLDRGLATVTATVRGRRLSAEIRVEPAPGTPAAPGRSPARTGAGRTGAGSGGRPRGR